MFVCACIYGERERLFSSHWLCSQADLVYPGFAITVSDCELLEKSFSLCKPQFFSSKIGILILSYSLFVKIN